MTTPRTARPIHSAPKSLLRPARTRVPASTSNLGAGFDCLGLALELHLDALYEPGPGRLRIERKGTLARLTGEDILVRSFRSALDRRGVRAGGLLRVESAIPVARGLGSSAAAAIAGRTLAAATLAEPVELDDTLAEVAAAEGHPDNAAAALYGGLVAAIFDEGRVSAFRLPLSGAIAWAWAAPAAEVDTARARAALPKSVRHALAARAVGRSTALVQGLATADADLLRTGFADELHVPWRLPLIPGGQQAMAAATEAGAWAVTISGSGSGLIAACPPGVHTDVARAMSEAFRAAAPGRKARDGVVARAVEPDAAGAQILPP